VTAMTNLQALLLQHHTQRVLLWIDQAIEIHLLEGKEEMIDPKVAALITQFDEATNKIAARIQKLIDAGGLSADSEAALQSVVNNLKSLGQDPENPVPPPVG